MLLTKLNNYHSATLLIAVSFTAILINPAILFILPGILLIILFTIYKKNFFIVFSFTSLVIVTGELGLTLRLAIQIINLLLLGYFFLKEYGTQFNHYPEIPKSILIFSGVLLFLIFTSSLVSNYSSLGFELLFRTAFFFIIVYIIYALLQNFDDLKIYTTAIFVSAIILLILVLYYLILAEFNIISFSQMLAMKGEESYIHKNSIGAFFVITISILLAVSFYIKKQLKVLIICAILFFLIGLFVTNSRGAILSLFFSCIYILYSVKRELLLKFLMVLVALLPLLFIESISSLLGLYLKVDMVASGRDYIIEAAYNIIKENSFFGIGPAATKYEMYSYLPFMLGSLEEFIFTTHFNVIQYGHAHNFYLFYFTDLGILGFLLSLSLPVIFLSLGSRVCKKYKETNNKYYFLALGIQAAGIALFIRGLFEWGGILSYGALATDLPFWWIFCILIFLHNNSDKIK